MKLIVIFIITILSSLPLIAHATEEDFQSWLLTTLSAPLSEDRIFGMYLEAQPRLGDHSSRLERSILRGAGTYTILPGLKGWLGYAWTPLMSGKGAKEAFTDEHRIWEQLTFDHMVKNFTLAHRLRYEQRFIEEIPEVSRRIRYLLRLSKSLTKVDSIVLGLTGYDEIFWNENSVREGSRSGFDRNRTFCGPYIEHGPIRAEIGHLYEIGVRPGSERRGVHAVLGQLGLNF